MAMIAYSIFFFYVVYIPIILRTMFSRVSLFPATVREGDLGRNLGVDAIGGQIPLIQFAPAQFFVGIFLKTMAEDNYFEGTRVFHG